MSVENLEFDEQGEREFLARYDASVFPHPSVSVDVVIVAAEDNVLKTLLMRRSDFPARGLWSLPGGFVGIKESLNAAATRILAEKLHLRDLYLEQLYTFGDPGRDPRTRVITVAYYALVDAKRVQQYRTNSGGFRLGKLQIPWQGEVGGPVQAVDDDGTSLSLAFDHADILGMVVQRLRGKLNYAPISFELIPKRFTLRQLQSIHETILDRRLNKDSFRRRMLASGMIAPTGEREADVGHRPAELYRFTQEAAEGQPT